MKRNKTKTPPESSVQQFAPPYFDSPAIKVTSLKQKVDHTPSYLWIALVCSIVVAIPILIGVGCLLFFGIGG